MLDFFFPFIKEQRCHLHWRKKMQDTITIKSDLGKDFMYTISAAVRSSTEGGRAPARWRGVGSSSGVPSRVARCGQWLWCPLQHGGWQGAGSGSGIPSSMACGEVRAAAPVSVLQRLLPCISTLFLLMMFWPIRKQVSRPAS